MSKHVSLLREIELSYKENIFTFEFSALDYRSPQKNQYAYKLEGVDPDWVHTSASRRFATYTNLNPGSYTFRVKASNKDGIWNEEGISIQITITPPIWQTSWAYMLYVILFGSVLTSIGQQATIREEVLDLDTYNFSDPNPIPHNSTMYPY